MKVTVSRPVLVSNAERAKENRTFFDRAPSLVVNVIASPGAGKTSLIERLAGSLKTRFRVIVIEGDIRGSVDSDRIRRLGIDTIQINTVTACHLDAFMIAQVLPQIKRPYDLVLVENVGNLVCPAEFEIGEDFKLAILSTAEGDDKPMKYPLVFHLAKVVVINKRDLLRHVDFSVRIARRRIREVNRRAVIFETSARTGQGFERLAAYLATLINRKKKK